jgi:hypothetical protein
MEDMTGRASLSFFFCASVAAEVSFAGILFVASKRMKMAEKMK